MRGDQADFVRRLKTTLPLRWFGDSSPVLDAVLGGLSASWASVYGLLSFVIAQTRISTSTGLWLDLVARDYFGSRLARGPGQPDTVLRARIQRELLRERGTRNAIRSILVDLTGRAPSIVEPARPTDTGVWGQMAGYGVAGGWGSLSLPFQCFVTAYRPLGNGIAQVAGWGVAAGGYGKGSLEYAGSAMSQSQVSDKDIYAAIAGVLPVASVAWTRIVN